LGAPQGTTGALVLARTKALARELSQQFRTRAIDKSYLALVHGDAGSFLAKEGLIDTSLRIDDGRVRVQAAASDNGDGRGAQAALPLAVVDSEPLGKVAAARTKWEVLASSVSLFAESKSANRVGSPQSLK
jgi:23S rRNA-/tRNA-specific pseudouridylate synthase